MADKQRMADARTDGVSMTVGPAFPLHELTMMRDWARAAGLLFLVRLDYAAEGALIEELVTLRNEANTRSYVLWRGPRTIVGQADTRFPQAFPSVAEALRDAGAHFLAGHPGTGRKPLWRRLLPF